jgi:hypothetical protein
MKSFLMHFDEVLNKLLRVYKNSFRTPRLRSAKRWSVLYGKPLFLRRWLKI